MRAQLVRTRRKLARMRPLLVLLLAAALLGGCMNRPPRHDRSGEISYNRRELTHPQPGILTGDDGVWTVYRSDAERAAPAEPPQPEPPAPKRREILLCDHSAHCAEAKP